MISIPPVWLPSWWLPYNNLHERDAERLYQMGGATQWVYRDEAKRFQYSEESEQVNEPPDPTRWREGGDA